MFYRGIKNGHCCSLLSVQQTSFTSMPPKTATGLAIAAFQGDAQAVAAWLHEGGGVDARSAEHNNQTLLMAAAMGGQEAVVRMLLQRGASVNLQDSIGGTALMLTAANGHTPTVQALLDAKADASLYSSDGCTALMIAEQQKHTAIAQLLRQHAKHQAPGCSYSPMGGSLVGRRVRIAGLKGRPELNGRSGVAAYFDAAKGRYAVTVEGEAEAVLLKPANLQASVLTLTQVLTLAQTPNRARSIVPHQAEMVLPTGVT